MEKLRGICKAATITVPPNIYRGNPSDEQLQEALEALLEKHGLDANAGAVCTLCMIGWSGWMGGGMRLES